MRRSGSSEHGLESVKELACARRCYGCFYSAQIQELDLSYARTSDGATPATWASRTNSATDVTPIFSITRPR